jgi:putative SOS response-associated peptidase YedK
MTPKNDFEVYWRRVARQPLRLADYGARTVGPFGQGVFLRPGPDSDVIGQLGQWAMIRPGSPPPKPGEKRYNTNNARIESITDKPTYRQAWAAGRRCLIPADWYAEPNWETGKNIWWHLKRADGLPWMLAGLWDEWTDRDTGEVVPNFTMLTVNCDGHLLLARLHKPERDKAGAVLPADQQDKRSLVHIDPADWDRWLHGSEADARELLTPQSSEKFDQADARRTDAILATLEPPGLF